MRYAFLRENSILPVIISCYLIGAEKEKLLRILGDHKEALG